MIETLVSDIYRLFSHEYVPLEAAVGKFGDALSKRIAERVSEERAAPSLRLSNLGSPCRRKLYYSVNHSSEAEPLEPEARMKFLYGDILEELLLFLAAEAGHTVEGEQDNVDLYGVEGHIDSIIDGMLVDVKSASSYSYAKFAAGLKHDDDTFGYLTQLGGYLHSLRDDPRVVYKDTAAFLVIDKTLGKVCLDVHKFSRDTDWERKVRDARHLLAQPVAPRRDFLPEPEGQSGNLKLPTVPCGYCQFKKTCHPGLRSFMYYKGPVHLTHIVREPNVPEIITP